MDMLTWEDKLKEEVRVFMKNKEITPDEIEILKENGRFTKVPYVAPYEDPDVTQGKWK
jgi:hypothetical protein|tara:strand:- start:61 stop:234 length:174 start_codon:yes stop_codon:yes gene_type:complete